MTGELGVAVIGAGNLDADPIVGVTFDVPGSFGW